MAESKYTFEIIKAVIERSSLGRTSQTIASSVGLHQREVGFIVEQFRYGQNARQITEKMNKKGFTL